MPLSSNQYTCVIPQGMKTTISITIYTTYPTVVKPLTNYTATFTVKDMLSGTILLTLSTAAGGIVITPASGLITITVLTAQAALIAPGPNLRFQLDIIDPDGEVEERVKGPVTGAEDDNE